MSLALHPSPDGAALRVEIGGVLDEYTDFAAIVAPSRRLEVDFGAVTRCNSMGVMRWTRLLKGLPATLAVHLQRCPQVLVKQFNIYRAFLDHPGIVVDSFQVALVCGLCDRGKAVLVEGAADSESVSIPPETCSCGGAFELDGPRDVQLRFLDRRHT